MLVLSRKLNESIMIGDSIVVTVVEIRGNKIRLGITAPPDVTILRDDVKHLAPPADSPRYRNPSDPA